MGKHHLSTLTLAIICLLTALAVRATEDDRLSWGADIRMRLTHEENEIFNYPAANQLSRSPATEYIRVRERFWIGYQVNDLVKVDARLVNMWRHYSSAPWSPNNTSVASNNGGTWQFPDEVIFDKLSLTVTDLLDQDGLSLTLGRQDLILGNGMIVLEGTIADAGRTIYMDGGVLTWKTDQDLVKVFVMYNTRADEFLVVNDRNRQIRFEDTFFYGVDWTHHLMQELNTELYAMNFTTKHDEGRVPPGYSDVDLWVYGGRVFGQLLPTLDYSVEYAHQNGERTATDIKSNADMFDARVGFNYPEWWSAPRLEFEYTYMSGDKRSAGEIEGWHAIYAGYPIWREEYLPTQNRGQWTNIEQIRMAVIANPTDKLRVTVSQSLLHTPEEDVNGGAISNPNYRGTGKAVGVLTSLFLDYTVMKDKESWLKSWVASFELAHLEQGDAYVDAGGSGDWIRLQNVWTF